MAGRKGQVRTARSSRLSQRLRRSQLSRFSQPSQGALYPRAWLVLALFAAVALVLLLWPGEGQSGGAQVVQAGESVGSAISAVGSGDVEGLAQTLSEKPLSQYGTELPEGAQSEVPFPAGALCSAGSDGVVVGFTSEGDVSSAFSQVKAEMEEKGWTYVSSGSQAAATFAKDDGTYRWATATCTEVSGGTAVVINARGCNG